MPTTTNEPRQPRVYSPEEIELFLSSDSRSTVDKLLIQSLNDIASALIPHMKKVDDLIELHGEPEAVRTRVEWVNIQMTRQQSRTKMMQKVTASALSYVLIAFIGFLAYSSWDYIVEAIKATHSKVGR